LVFVTKTDSFVFQLRTNILHNLGESVQSTDNLMNLVSKLCE